MLNRVPAEPFIPVIKDYLESQDDVSMNNLETRLDGPAVLLAESLGVHRDTLRYILDGRIETIDFDIVDRIMCVTGRIETWVNDQLYLTTPIPEGPRHHSIKTIPEKARCESKGCSNEFPTRKVHGGRDRRFCSETCRQREARRRRRAGVKPRFSNPHDRCVHGHDWSPENTILVGGRRRCKTCVYGRNEVERQRRRALQRGVSNEEFLEHD